MKTPKRNPDEKRGRYARHYLIIDRSRWKRKNRVAQLKRTIARMPDEARKFRELWSGGHLNFGSPEWEVFMILRKLKMPAENATLDEKLDHWLTLRKAAALAVDAACFAAKAYGEAKERAACQSKTAENAKQGNLLCPDAEQLTERKGN